MHVIISIHSLASRCYVDLLNCNGSRNTNIHYIQYNNFAEYLPIHSLYVMYVEREQYNNFDEYLPIHSPYVMYVEREQYNNFDEYLLIHSPVMYVEGELSSIRCDGVVRDTE